MLLREVTVRHRDDAGNASAPRDDGDALRFVELMPELMRCRAGWAHPQVSVARDLADYIGRKVQATRDHAPRSPAANSPDEIAEAVD